MATVVNVPLNDRLENALEDYRRAQKPIPPKVRAVESILTQFLQEKGYLPPVKPQEQG